MRLQLTKEILEMVETLEPYMIYTLEEGCHPRPDSPQEIFDLYRRFCEESDKLEEEWRRENW